MSAHKKRRGVELFRGPIAAAVIAAMVAVASIAQVGRTSSPARPLSTLAAVAAAVPKGVIAATSTVTHTLVPAPTAIHTVTGRVAEAVFAAKVPFGDIIWREAKKNALAPELVAAVVRQESQFKASARSYRGALGLMQLLPATGRWMGARDLRNPQQNIAAGTKYLRYLYDEFGGDEKKVIAAYNAGDGNVRRFGGLPPFRETRKYVANVLRFQNEFRNAMAAAAGATARS